uniref:Disease resistance protein RPP13 n=2 Tax=Triticum urartu TaxID=4572 RepID=A0A8R7UPD5_TRIUA
MAAEIVSATMGVVNPLIGKLTELLGEEYRKLTGVRRQAMFLKDELSSMKALLDKLELVDKLDPQAKDWRDHVREMSYDMENCIDDFMHDLEGADGKKGFVRKMAQRLRRLGRRHQIANQIEELKIRAIEENARRQRYKIDDSIHSSSTVVAVDPRVSAIYEAAANLVGIDGPREELVSWLTNSERKLKVVSIVGFVGLGKTTLAKQVYEKIGGQFDCKAFISVSQKPNMPSLLNGLGLDLGIGIGEDSRARKVPYIIRRLREYLTHKRYLIVVDDLWDPPTWDILRCVFAEGGNGNTVIVTTRVDVVACRASHEHDGHIYRMKPLNNEDSKRLFFGRVFRSEDSCAPQYEEVSTQILKKCGGLPLAIITISSLLASRQAKSRSDWESIMKSLGTNFATDPTLEGMKNILNLSYMHLPPRLRACFLYLGLHPEDREIRRDDLARQWVAEGFVSSVPELDLEDVAKSYFNELINRSLIQPAETIYGEVTSCRVHDMILDLILSKCAEENFMHTAHSYGEMEKMHSCKYKVRRLSLNLSAGGATPGSTLATGLSQVRSFAQFGESIYAPPLESFKHVRVLVFEVPGERSKLGAICHLFQLRYLKVSADSVELPADIRGLVHLKTLEMNCWSEPKISSDIVHLPNLFNLRLPYGTGLPEGIRNMTSIRTLRCSSMEKSLVEDITGLGELTNLRNLCLSGGSLTVEGVDALVSSIGKLRDLRQLYLGCRLKGYNDQLGSLPDPPSRLEALNLGNWLFYVVPKWIGGLRDLMWLSLNVDDLSSHELRILGELPSLVRAYLSVSRIPKDKIVVGSGSFPVLEHISLDSDEDVAAYLRFEAGAMRSLRVLAIRYTVEGWSGCTPDGMEHLLCLEQVNVRVYGT